MTKEVYIDGIPLKDYGKPSSKSFYPKFQQIENGYKVSVPLFNELELKELDYNIENNYNELIEQIYKSISRDREIIVLKKVIQKQDTEINKLKNVIEEYEKECRQFKAFCRKIRRDDKHDVDEFNQGQEQKCNQFLNLLAGEKHWTYEGKYFDETDKQIEKMKEDK